MNAETERKALIDRRLGEISGEIRRSLVDPSEAAIATLTRIAAQDFSPAVAAHLVEQLGELQREIRAKLAGEAGMIRRLGNGLSHFEKRLFAMEREERRK